MTQLFINEIKIFSAKNWWVYIGYILLLAVIYYLGGNNLPVIVIISTGHFIADILIMMMFTAYNQRKPRLGTNLQVASMLLFLLLKLATGFNSGDWRYLSTDLVYALSAYKNYQLDIRKKKIKAINPVTLTALSVVIVFGIIYPLEVYFDTKFFNGVWQAVQITGVFLFGIALSYTGYEKRRNQFSAISLFIMVLGSVMVLITSLFVSNHGNTGINGLDVSYSLLPLTVLIFYLRKR